MKMVIVLPTRHRPAFAIAAIRSLLSPREPALSVIVSDNSSNEADVRAVAEFCRGVDDDRLTYIRPPEVLPMPTHWNWALERALERADATHIGVTYDRKVWRPGSIQQLADVCRSNPERLVTYVCDFTYAKGDAAGSWQMPTTGKLYELRTARILELASEGLIDEMGQTLPLLSNCVIPRRYLEQVRERFDDICDSSTPDMAFAYRFCAIEERFLFLDRPLGILHGFAYSNGAAMYRGESGGTWGDFVKLWGDRPWADGAPLVDLRFSHNVGFHEYNRVRTRIGGDPFPPIQREGYLRTLGRGLALLQDPIRKAEVRAILEQQGWREEVAEPPSTPRRVLHALRHVADSVRERVRPRSVNPAVETNGLSFGTDEEAVRYLLANVRAFEPKSAYLEDLHAVEWSRA